MSNTDAANITTITITDADNQVSAYLNGVAVVTERHPGTLDSYTDFTNQLQEGTNNLLVLGANWGGPYAYKGRVNIYGDVSPFDQSGGNSEDGITWSQYFTFEKV